MSTKYSICKNCKIPFKKRYKNDKRIYCSPNCAVEGRSYETVCLVCGTGFKSNAINALYCSDCKSRKCEYCGKVFILSNSEIKGTEYNKPRKFCSGDCFHNSVRGRIPWNKKESVVIICEICGKSFEVWESRLTRNVKYCSRKCKDDGMSNITGINHPLWKGGHDIYSRMLSENKGSFYRNRKIVLERDDYTCQYCGDRRETRFMDVHHIVPVIKNGANLPENMITLCRKCHNHADRGLIKINKLLIA